MLKQLALPSTRPAGPPLLERTGLEVNFLSQTLRNTWLAGFVWAQAEPRLLNSNQSSRCYRRALW